MPVGAKEQFVQAYGEQHLGRFIRNIVGLDVNAAKQAFSALLSNCNLNSRQIHFINTIIDYLTVNGTIDPDMLYDSPFTDISSSGIRGLFDHEQSERIMQVIEKVNGNAAA